MLISVIIPIYNSEDTIGACIESVLSQSFTDLELILVNDGSKDDSGRICDEYAVKDGRIQTVHQVNKGRTEARKVGVEHATGKWVCFVDSDDTLPVDALRDLYNATTDETDIVLGNGYSLSPESRNTIPMSEFRHMTVRAEGTIGVPWGSIYRRKVLTPYLFDLPRHIINGEDYLFWLRLVFSTERPVNIVYESVYNKGAEHTSNCFKWTADYCYELNELRESSIPSELYDEYLPDMIADRLANMFAVAVCQSRKEWRHSRYYKEILRDLKKVGSSLTIKQRIFLSIPSLRIRKMMTSL